MTPDTKDNQQDVVSVKEGDSAVESQRDSTPQKTYTEEEVELKFSSQRSVLDKKIAEKDKLLQSYVAREAELTARQLRLDAEEEERYADDMPTLTALRAERRQKANEEAKKTELADREAKADARDAEFADIMERDKIRKRTELAAEVATAKGVSIDAILKLAKEDTREAYETVAELLPQVDPLPTVLPHSPGGQRGGINWRDLSPSEGIRYALDNPKK